MSGLPDVIPDGSRLTLTCYVLRIKPEATDIYWLYDGVRNDGSLSNRSNTDGTSSQSNSLQLKYVNAFIF